MFWSLAFSFLSCDGGKSDCVVDSSENAPERRIVWLLVERPTSTPEKSSSGRLTIMSGTSWSSQLEIGQFQESWSEFQYEESSVPTGTQFVTCFLEVLKGELSTAGWRWRLLLPEIVSWIPEIKWIKRSSAGDGHAVQFSIRVSSFETSCVTTNDHLMSSPAHLQINFEWRIASPLVACRLSTPSEVSNTLNFLGTSSGCFSKLGYFMLDMTLS